ncbi:hypothetical protein [Neotamlana nanhaiensis]|uniref:hypothetical protein n=1 Tax=Neotamlana nanhaiensis TaxID=1382798 RepID=UPI00103E4022|nr:hypothetical protein [Tamlana nanhaiensis]
MNTKLKSLLIIPFFVLLFFSSCQKEAVEITNPEESEALAPNDELTNLMFSTSTMDGSYDNILDNASCISVELPVTVIVNGLDVTIDSKEDFKTIEAIFNEFEDDDDALEIIFPITIVLSDYEEIVIENREQLKEIIKECKGENEEDDDIECIDFQYPISFSVFNRNFEIINVVDIENDRQLYRFIKRIKNEANLIASLNFPITLVYADGNTVEVHNNAELAQTIKEAKDACDEDDDNDYGDDDFTKERLDEYLKLCPWVVHEFKRNEQDRTVDYDAYALKFKEDNVVVMRARNGDVLTGTWSTRVTDNGAMIKLEFDTLADFTLEWFVYDLAPGRIKFYQSGGNRIIMKKNCDVLVEITKERIENYLQECYWRVARLNVDGADNDKKYIGTPLKFLENNQVKIRVEGEFVTGTYDVLAYNSNGFVLQIQIDGRPYLQLEWFVTVLEEGLIKLENLGNRDDKMVLKRHCFDTDDDVKFIDAMLIQGAWEVAYYQDANVDKTDIFYNYTFNFKVTGRVEVANPNGVSVVNGSWLSYRDEGLYLGLYFKDNEPFNILNHRWKILEIAEGRIEVKDLAADGSIERILVLEKKS